MVVVGQARMAVVVVIVAVVVAVVVVVATVVVVVVAMWFRPYVLFFSRGGPLGGNGIHGQLVHLSRLVVHAQPWCSALFGLFWLIVGSGGRPGTPPGLPLWGPCVWPN